MSPARPSLDAVLCEACGYPLDASSRAGNGAPLGRLCPECGRPARESDPTRRTPSPWEARPGPLSWAATVRAVLLRPRAFFAGLRMRGLPMRSRLFLLISAIAVGLTVASPGAGLSLLGRPTPGLGGGAGAAAVPPVWWWLLGMGSVKLTLLMAYVEVVGLCLIGRRRGWRYPLRRAERLVAYASPGFPVGVAAGWVVMPGLLAAVGAMERRGWLPPVGLLALVSPQTLAVAAAMVWLPVLGFCVYLGVGLRETRYANG